MLNYIHPRKNISILVMTEAAIIQAIRKYLSTIPELFFWKEHGGQYGTAGIPDLICCYRGFFVAIEVKTSTGRLTKLQDLTLEDIRKAGGIAVVARSVDDTKQIFESLKNFNRR